MSKCHETMWTHSLLHHWSYGKVRRFTFADIAPTEADKLRIAIEHGATLIDSGRICELRNFGKKGESWLRGKVSEIATTDDDAAFATPSTLSGVVDKIVEI